jgi:hypothetical protein
MKEAIIIYSRDAEDNEIKALIVANRNVRPKIAKIEGDVLDHDFWVKLDLFLKANSEATAIIISNILPKEMLNYSIWFNCANTASQVIITCRTNLTDLTNPYLLENFKYIKAITIRKPLPPIA